jgi:hypothetical protein
MLLHFTEFGLYCQTGSGTRKEHYAEGPMSGASYITYSTLMHMIGEYMIRSLTYPEDILRAFTGILTALYGNSTSFGMPWKDFSNAILWLATDFDHEPR